jgi:hypothetical protein
MSTLSYLSTRSLILFRASKEQHQPISLTIRFRHNFPRQTPFREIKSFLITRPLEGRNVMICSNMTYSEQHGGSDSLHDMGDSSQYQYPPLPEDGDDRIKPYYQQTSSSNISVILPSISHDTLGPQPHSHPQDSLANLPDTGDAQLPLPEYGRNQHGSWNGSQHMSFTQSAPRQRAAIACRYCRRRKVRCSPFLSRDIHKHRLYLLLFELPFQERRF